MTEKKTTTKNSSAKKSPAKKTPAKKAPAKKAPAKKTPAKKVPAKKVTAKKTVEVKQPVDTAPYLTKAENNVNNERSHYIVPALLVLALSVVIVATFYADQFNNLVAKLNFGSDTQETIVASTDTESDAALTEEASSLSSETSSEAIATSDSLASSSDTDSIASKAATSETDASSTLAATTASATQTVDSTAVQTSGVTSTQSVTNRNVTSQSSAMTAQPFNARPSWAVANTPYTRGETQSKPYNDMRTKQKEAFNEAMQQRKEMMLQINAMRKIHL